MKAMPDETETRTNEPTPSGGAYSIAYWQDADGNPVDKSSWVQAEVIEFTADGEHLQRNYFANKEKQEEIGILDM
jgi:hypothetical protein